MGGVLVDYVRATVPADLFDEVRRRVGVCGWEPRAGGWRGWYDRAAGVLGVGVVAWCSSAAGAARQGVLVDLPGSACAALGADLLPFVGWLVSVGHVARLDVAVDDRAGLITFDRLWAATETGRVVTRSRGWRWLIGGTPGTGARVGWTLYVGAPTSGAMLRVYDRAAAVHDRSGVPWVRVELAARGALAGDLARQIAAGDAGGVLAAIAGHARMVETARADRNRWRWPVCDWWAGVVGRVRRGRHSIKAGERADASVERMRAWVERVAAPTLWALVAGVDGGSLDWLAAAIAAGGERQRTRHRLAVGAAVGGAHVVTGGG